MSTDFFFFLSVCIKYFVRKERKPQGTDADATKINNLHERVLNFDDISHNISNFDFGFPILPTRNLIICVTFDNLNSLRRQTIAYTSDIKLTDEYFNRNNFTCVIRNKIDTKKFALKNIPKNLLKILQGICLTFVTMLQREIRSGSSFFTSDSALTISKTFLAGSNGLMPHL